MSIISESVIADPQMGITGQRRLLFSADMNRERASADLQVGMTRLLLGSLSQRKCLEKGL
jgi:hypothetical protein